MPRNTEDAYSSDLDDDSRSTRIPVARQRSDSLQLANQETSRLPAPPPPRRRRRRSPPANQNLSSRHNLSPSMPCSRQDPQSETFEHNATRSAYDSAVFDIPSTLLLTHNKRHVIWTSNTKEDFRMWHAATSYVEWAKKHSKSLPTWDPATKSSKWWKHFDEVADVATGKPGLKCIHCGHMPGHPATSNSGGTSQMKHHVESKQCKKNQPGASQPGVLDVFAAAAKKVCCYKQLFLA
jgi:hypothetical protein